MKKNQMRRWWGLVGILTIRLVDANEPKNETVFRNLPFQLVQQHGSSCMQVESRDFELHSCINDPESGKCYPRNRAVMKSCGEGVEEQNWFFDAESQYLHLSGFPRGFCLTRMVRSVEMQPCAKEGNIAQQWYFTEEGLLKSRADNNESGSFLYAVENQELTFFHLKYQFTAPELEAGQCYIHPVTGLRECTLAESASDDQKPDDDEEKDSKTDDDDKASTGIDEGDGSEGESGDHESGDSSSDETADEEGQEPPKKPKPKYWLSKRLTPMLALKGVGGRCLELKVPDSCSPILGDESSLACAEGASVNIADCSASDAQHWQHDLQTKKIYNKLSGYGVCLTLKEQGLFMGGCFVNAEDTQRWYFSKGGKGSYGQKGKLRTMLNGLKTPYLYTRHIDIPAGMAKESGKLQYEIQPEQPEGCWFHPVTGEALKACK